MLDNIEDEKGIKKFAYKILSVLLKSSHNKAAKDYPLIEKAVKNYITEQQTVEKSGCHDIDAAAQPTSDVLSYLFSLCSENDNDKRALSRLGYCLGRFIYIADAIDDYEKDIKKGRFNPLSDYNDAKERAERNIYLCINEAISAFELINIQKFKNILGNIIYMGLEDGYKRSKLNERPL